jgi:uncharacterized protein DUF4340
MSAKHLKLIAVGLVVLLLLWGGSELLSRGSDSVTGSLTLPALAPTEVDTVSVIKGTDSIVLAKQSPTAWSVNGHRAAPDAVHDVFQALADTTRPELIAQAPASFARLGVDSATGRWLRLSRAGKPLVEIIIGTRGTDVQSVYLRRPGDGHVYLWKGRLASLADRDVDGWRDQRIAALEPDSVAALDVVRGKDRYRLARVGRTWSMNGSRTDSAAVARYLERLKAITASGFATPKEVDSTSALRPARRLSVHGARRLLLSLAFDSAATGFVVRHLAGVGGDGSTVYRMNLWDVDGITPASRSLVPPKK